MAGSLGLESNSPDWNSISTYLLCELVSYLMSLPSDSSTVKWEK